MGMWYSDEHQFQTLEADYAFPQIVWTETPISIQGEMHFTNMNHWFRVEVRGAMAAWGDSENVQGAWVKGEMRDGNDLIRPYATGLTPATPYYARIAATDVNPNV